ncbi:hypothetical protein SAMN03159488_05589 [Pseudomonas sp. NFIX10]|uniref:DUF4810 domain-containing protein n=1 Tax=Pseudomonas TaxID=286 RepID=UPI0008712478|nr:MULTISPECIES: DUF4810 domain-containing protein [unclassified Pseudomonas]SCW99467.1 hypothetical protein SAMN03159481_05634 [Pseudomonas sp. NFACC56-3]SFB58937.1 hypothetical protein SAMN03159488_05589 [Pseudomonas sp. NFIX10]SFF55022.1 hypothetical protein SAMN03159367_05230 [Pseudomonas sp. NFACC06-1]SFL04724.1 hypothetical protein SAMN03159473_05469 [Pseudomonas sp. NFACC52]
MNKAVKLALMLTAVATVAGCQTAPQSLYQWESYQPQVYEYFKGEPKEAQVEALERDLQKINASGRKAPPGYHAHLGMLYLSMGKDDQMVQQFRTEKVLFPESAAYMDFLLKNAKTGDVK